VSEQTSPRLSPRADGITALVFGLLPACGLGSLLALWFGYRGRRRLDAIGTSEGRGMATAGVVLGWVGLVFAAIYWLLVGIALVSGALS
jgi:hypothetical protein